MNITKRALGLYLGIVVAALGIAGFVLNRGVANSIGSVSGLLVIAAVVEIGIVALTLAAGARPVYNLVSIVTTVLFASALVQSFAPQMNQLGSVVSGLDDASTLSGFFTFVGVVAAGMILSIVANFLGKAKSA